MKLSNSACLIFLLPNSLCVTQQVPNCEFFSALPRPVFSQVAFFFTIASGVFASTAQLLRQCSSTAKLCLVWIPVNGFPYFNHLSLDELL